MGGAQALKRIPRIKFPPRHSTKFSGNGSQPEEALRTGSAVQAFFSSLKASTYVGGKASLQPKRTPVLNEEIEAILGHLITIEVLKYATAGSWVDVSELLTEL